jgi:imidazolonepropionase-like amidohydrolase
MVDTDTIPGPTIIAAGSWIGGRGGVCEFGGATIRGAAEARARAESDAAAGARILKLCITSWLDPVVANPDSVEMTEAEIAAVADVARAAHLPMAAHAIGAAGAMAAINAGVRILAHTPVVSDDQARAIGKSGACVSTTMTTLLQSQSAATLRASFARLRAAHVRLMLGTDAGVLAHGSNADELVTLVSLGMTPLEAVQAGTTVAAQCLGMGDYGSLAVGAPADIIGLTRSPLADISAAKQPALVVRSGRVITAPATPQRN